ncbi:MAG: bifunctional 5,10-methylenetetrahydrofolate dehydrogenase/5,10-methenyltetrahydrofolate cyclohydrolase [Treponema sp.]|jgi:methylenetetrahydrofolate dehydrogenase (NADP+)/methenyltetrahydrofolate cyclohydrolase|nr:bifunctional 5,10-methylenetetrahydrofolate dehydrogenase/5,10-methenyltetrahydrofolate cyclohydrolase [Treponema sp.]
MPAIIMDGKALGMKLREKAKTGSQKLRERGITPRLAVVLAGEDPASLAYVASKEKALAKAGMESANIRLPASASENALLSLITELNRDDSVHGILLQLPLPSHIDAVKMAAAIAPEKDVDCLGPVQAGKMFLGAPSFLPCTPAGVLELLREYAVPLAGARAVIAGRSSLVGKPLAILLSRKGADATVTLCHTGTRDLARHAREADILIAACGSPGLITPDMVKEGAAVIDVGISRVPDEAAKKGYSLRGDVDPAAVEKAAFFTPVPGGVGPVTVAMLLLNALRAAELAAKRK